MDYNFFVSHLRHKMTWSSTLVLEILPTAGAFHKSHEHSPSHTVDTVSKPRTPGHLPFFTNNKTSPCGDNVAFRNLTC